MININVKICIFFIGLFFMLLCGTASGDTTIESAEFIDSGAIDIVRALADMGGYDVVVGPSGNGVADKKVSLHMKEINCLDAIHDVLKIAGFKYQVEGKTILISTLPQDMANSAFEVCKPGAQVLIEGKVVEVSENAMRELGIKWGREAGCFRFAVNKDTGKIGLTEDLLITLKVLASEGRADILAEPSIMTLDGKEASINIGSRIPFATPASTSSTATQWTISYIDAGISLKITPKVSSDGYVVISLKPEVSSISEWRTTPAGDFPVISTRNAEAQIRVKDGETIMIGGLTNRSERENVVKIPFLGDIPIFGALFQNRVKEKVKTEVVFLITPKTI